MVAKLQEIIRYLDSFNGPAELGPLEELLTAISISRSDLDPLCVFGEQSYRRNPVKSSPWYDFLVICWHAGQYSPIHDHMGSSCAFKIVEGVATEVVCELTGGSQGKLKHVRPTRTRLYKKGEVCVSTSAHIHTVFNDQSPPGDLITLHVYSPPLKMGTYLVDPALDTENIARVFPAARPQYTNGQ